MNVWKWICNKEAQLWGRKALRSDPVFPDRVTLGESLTPSEPHSPHQKNRDKTADPRGVSRDSEMMHAKHTVGQILELNRCLINGTWLRSFWIHVL